MRYKISLFEMDRSFSKKGKFKSNLTSHERFCLLTVDSPFDAGDDFDLYRYEEEREKVYDFEIYERYEKNGRMKKRESKLFWVYVNSTNDSFSPREKKDRVFLSEKHKHCKFCNDVKEKLKEKEKEQNKNLEKKEGQTIKEFFKNEDHFNSTYNEHPSDLFKNSHFFYNDYDDDSSPNDCSYYPEKDYYYFCFHIKK
jgi:hypothetical protein